MVFKLFYKAKKLLLLLLLIIMIIIIIIEEKQCKIINALNVVC